MVKDADGGFEGLVAAPPASAVGGAVAGAGADTGADAGADAGSDTRAGTTPPPAGIRTMAPTGPSTTTRLVLVRHGEAECNVSGICGGIRGCTGLTAEGVRQVKALGDRLAMTGELAGADALYASLLPRAIETAELLAPALGSIGADGIFGPPPTLNTECGFCELHPGDADGLTWEEFSAQYPGPNWDEDPDQPIAPGGESWTGFVLRVAEALEGVVARHPGGLVVVACHAGVIEASLLSMLPLVGGRAGARLQLRTQHASLTTWEVEEGRWRLLSYNDASHLSSRDPTVSPHPLVAQQA